MLHLKGSHRFERSFVDGGIRLSVKVHQRLWRWNTGTEARSEGTCRAWWRWMYGGRRGSLDCSGEVRWNHGSSCSLFLAAHVDELIGLPKHFPYEGLVHPRILSMCSWVLFTKCGYLHVTIDLGRPAKHSFSRIVMNRLFLQRIEDLPLFPPSGQHIIFVVFFVGWTRTPWRDLSTHISHAFICHRWKDRVFTWNLHLRMGTKLELSNFLRWFVAIHQ